MYWYLWYLWPKSIMFMQQSEADLAYGLCGSSPLPPILSKLSTLLLNRHYPSAVWVKKIPPAACGFLTFFWQTVQNFKSIFTHLLYVPIYARVQIFIQLSRNLTKLCHIKRDYPVHVICSKCPPCRNARVIEGLRNPLIALLIVICGKSSQICCFYNVNKHVGYCMTTTVTSFAQ